MIREPNRRESKSLRQLRDHPDPVAADGRTGRGRHATASPSPRTLFPAARSFRTIRKVVLPAILFLFSSCVRELDDEKRGEQEGATAARVPKLNSTGISAFSTCKELIVETNQGVLKHDASMHQRTFSRENRFSSSRHQGVEFVRV